jgi:hypothetical protein
MLSKTRHDRVARERGIGFAQARARLKLGHGGGPEAWREQSYERPQSDASDEQKQ